MLVCRDCYGEFVDKKGLSYHVKIIHKRKFEDYLIEHDYGGVRPVCVCGCGKSVNFFGGKFCELAHKVNHTGMKRSAETRAKISAVQIGVPKTESFKKTVSETMKKHHEDNPEHAEISRQYHLGKKKTDEHRRKISETRKRMFAEGTLEINVEKMQESIVRKYLEGGFEWSRGSHYSPKTEKQHHYRSSWELRHMQEMDVDDSVIDYETEPARIEYELDGKKRIYIPDFRVRKVGEYDPELKAHKVKIELHEIGPKTLKQTHPKNIAKRIAAERWCKDLGYTYRLISFQ